MVHNMVTERPQENKPFYEYNTRNLEFALLLYYSSLLGFLKFIYYLVVYIIRVTDNQTCLIESCIYKSQNRVRYKIKTYVKMCSI